jgi:hypothetical protein
LFFERGRTDESGGPPLFEPPLKVEGDIGHVPCTLPRSIPAALSFSFGQDDSIDLRQTLVAVRSLPPRSRSSSASTLGSDATQGQRTDILLAPAPGRNRPKPVRAGRGACRALIHINPRTALGARLLHGEARAVPVPVCPVTWAG